MVREITRPVGAWVRGDIAQEFSLLTAFIVITPLAYLLTKSGTIISNLAEIDFLLTISMIFGAMAVVIYRRHDEHEIRQASEYGWRTALISGVVMFASMLIIREATPFALLESVGEVLTIWNISTITGVLSSLYVPATTKNVTLSTDESLQADGGTSTNPVTPLAPATPPPETNEEITERAPRRDVLAETTWANRNTPEPILDAIAEVILDLYPEKEYTDIKTYEFIDPEAFDPLRGRNDSQWQLTFHTTSFEIRVSSHGTVTVFDRHSIGASPTNPEQSASSE